MSKHNDTKASLKDSHGAAGKPQVSNTSLLLSLIKFMAWVIVIGLLLSPLACTVEQSEVANEQQGGNDE